ncbi:MAG: hypothetical protein ACOCTR_03590 [Candidatus Natronoplasma sp.]
MKTILYTDLINRRVNLPDEFKRGKIKDVLAEPSEGIWTVHELMVTTGLFRKESRFFFTYELQNVGKEGSISVMKTMEEARKEPSEASEFYMDEIYGRKVETSHGHEIGRVYDYELSLDLEPWTVWKLLVEPSNLSPYKRRKRLSIENVEKVEKNKIIFRPE